MYGILFFMFRRVSCYQTHLLKRDCLDGTLHTSSACYPHGCERHLSAEGDMGRETSVMVVRRNSLHEPLLVHLSLAKNLVEEVCCAECTLVHSAAALCDVFVVMKSPFY